MIDGCTKSQAFWRVTFPLLAPGLVATGIFAFIQAWNEFTMALLLMKGYNLTLPDVAQLVPVRDGGDQLGRRHGGLDADRDPRRHLLPHRAGAHDRRPRRRGGQGLMRAAHARRLPQGGRPMKVGLDVGGHQDGCRRRRRRRDDRRPRAPRDGLGSGCRRARPSSTRSRALAATPGSTPDRSVDRHRHPGAGRAGLRRASSTR